MPRSSAQNAWIKENTVYIGLNLNKHTDADILSAVEGKAKQTEIKRLLRIGIAHEKDRA